MESWWHLDVEQTAKELGTDLSSGLNSGEAAARLERYGRNQLQEAPKRSPWAIFLDQFKDFMIWVLIGAAIVSGVLQEVVDAVAIIAIVILNAILGFVQEYRAEKSLAALKKLSSPTSKVIRGGKHALIPSEELVPGDRDRAGGGRQRAGRQPGGVGHVQLQRPGGQPDGRIHAGGQDGGRAGRTRTCRWRTGPTWSTWAPPSPRAGPRAIVTETGMQTELGKIAGMIQEIEQESTPLQKKLEQFGKWIVYLCFVLVAMVFFLEWARGGKMIEVFLTAVSLAVAAIPEGLPAVVTIALALGVQRMVKRHALIRRLRSVETLGSATVICSDKTGTLTKNEMTVQAVFAGGQLFRVTGIGYAPKGEFLAGGQERQPAGLPGSDAGPEGGRAVQRRATRAGAATPTRSWATPRRGRC